MLLFNLVATTIDKPMKSFSLNRIFFSLSIIAVVSGVITGFWLLGSPALQRKLKADEQRLQNLHRIARDLHQEAVDNNLEETFMLPQSLPEEDYTVDPISGEPYKYQVINTTIYQLCAEFGTDSDRINQTETSYQKFDEFWQHPQGTHCFELDVQETPPNLYDYN